MNQKKYKFNPLTHEVQKYNEETEEKEEDKEGEFNFHSNFGKPGCGAPCKNQTKRTLMLSKRFDPKIKAHHWIHSKPF